MLVIALLMLAAVALGVGWATEEILGVQVALGASVLAAGVTVWRILDAARSRGVEQGEGAEVVADHPGRSAVTDSEADTDSEAHAGAGPGVGAELSAGADSEPTAAAEIDPVGAQEPAADVSPGDEVVFLPRRSTFHAPTCSAVVDRPVARGLRADLVAAGMTPCRRCLPAPPG